MSTYGSRRARNCSTCRGFYLLVFYILIANLKASDICVRGGVGGGVAEEGCDGGVVGWLVLPGKEITLRPFL